MSFYKLYSGTLFTAALLLISLSNSSIADEHTHKKYNNDVALCGHEEHDDPALRSQAATRNYWRDSRAANPEAWVRFKILGLNDFHGQLESRTLFDRPAGGAAVLASYLQGKSTESENGAIIVHAGDHVGASPPVSALLQDEPSITFLNMLSNKHCDYAEEKDDIEEGHKGKAYGSSWHHHNRDERLNPRCNLVGTVGNHEFDEGVTEMIRLLDGGIHPDGPFLDEEYRGARFPYVAANVVDEETNEPLLPPYVIKRVRGMPIAFIGAVLRETPTIVTPTGVAGVRFLDEAEAINHYVPELKSKGVRAIVVTIHQGTRQSFFSGPTNPEPADIGGSIGPIVAELHDEIDIVVAGHWHSFTNALMPNKTGKLILVTQAFSRSTAFSDIDVSIDPASRDIVEKSASILTTWGDEGYGLEPNEEVSELVNEAVAAVQPLVERVIAVAANDILRAESEAGESALGNLIADAQRTAMNTQLAFMNPGGIRADIAAGEVTWGELFTVQPFNNDLVKMELNGTQIVELLNQQWVGQPYPRIMKPSGISYSWLENDPASYEDNRVVEDSILINGQSLDLSALYTVTVNSFMAAGGDNFSVLAEGSNRVVGPVDLDALVEYIQGQQQPITAAIEGRIQVQP